MFCEAQAEVGSLREIAGTPHLATFSSCNPTDLYRLGVNKNCSSPPSISMAIRLRSSHTGLTFSSCGHWTVSLIWDWECCPCILAIYSRTTTSHYQCSRSLPSGIAPPLPNPKTWEQDHDVGTLPESLTRFSENCLHISSILTNFA